MSWFLPMESCAVIIAVHAHGVSRSFFRWLSTSTPSASQTRLTETKAVWVFQPPQLPSPVSGRSIGGCYPFTPLFSRHSSHHPFPERQ